MLSPCLQKVSAKRSPKTSLRKNLSVFKLWPGRVWSSLRSHPIRVRRSPGSHPIHFSVTNRFVITHCALAVQRLDDNTTHIVMFYRQRFCLLMLLSLPFLYLGRILFTLGQLDFQTENTLVGERLSPNPAKASNEDHILLRGGKCAGKQDYVEWIKLLFELAPQAPSCKEVQTFVSEYNDSAKNHLLPCSLLIQRNEKIAPYYRSVMLGNNAGSWRAKAVSEMWNKANMERHMPPNVEMVIYHCDKPRSVKGFRLPTFSFAVDNLPYGSGSPTEWKDPLPFPSYFYGRSFPHNMSPDVDFYRRRPVVYFRGLFSESIWSHRLMRHTLLNSSAHMSSELLSLMTELGRFKLALAGANPKDQDVLDIQLTGFANIRHKDDQLDPALRSFLLENFNISMGKWQKVDLTKSRYAVSVVGNGWPGATSMGALLSGSCMLAVQDNSTDPEGFSRSYGEIYFPFLRPWYHYVPVTYETLASTARKLNMDSGNAFQISRNSIIFAKKYLGMECALDVIEAIAWEYYRYIKRGCNDTFSHIIPQGPQI